MRVRNWFTREIGNSRRGSSGWCRGWCWWTSEEIEELTNQQIFDLAMQREEEEEGEETTVNEEIISNKDELDFNEDDFNSLINPSPTNL